MSGWAHERAGSRALRGGHVWNGAHALHKIGGLREIWGTPREIVAGPREIEGSSREITVGLREIRESPRETQIFLRC